MYYVVTENMSREKRCTLNDSCVLLGHRRSLGLTREGGLEAGCGGTSAEVFSSEIRFCCLERKGKGGQGNRHEELVKESPIEGVDQGTGDG